MGSKEHVSTRVDPHTKTRIEQYKQRHGCETFSEAAEQVLEVGLRESHSPLLYRAKDLSIEAAWYLAIGGVISVLLGFTTTGLTAADGIRVAAVFLSCGASLVAGVELVRFLTGDSLLNGQSVASMLTNLR